MLRACSLRFFSSVASPYGPAQIPKNADSLGIDIVEQVGRSAFLSGYYEKGIVVEDELVETPCLLLPHGIVLSLAIKTIKDLAPHHLTALQLCTPPAEVLLIGTGEQNRMDLFLGDDFRNKIKEAGIAKSLEVIDTVHAISTFNIIAGEGRRVAAVFMGANHQED
jgi:uncharacterized protein